CISVVSEFLCCVTSVILPLSFILSFFLCFHLRPPSLFTLFPYTTLFRSVFRVIPAFVLLLYEVFGRHRYVIEKHLIDLVPAFDRDRKSTRLNSSHGSISYAVFCLKKKKKKLTRISTEANTNSQI